MKLCKNIHCSVWQLLGLNKFKMAAIAMVELKKTIKSPPILFPWQLWQFVQPIPIFWAYLVPLDVDVVPTRFHQFLFGEISQIFAVMFPVTTTSSGTR
jgi:hypothetical protein